MAAKPPQQQPTFRTHTIAYPGWVDEAANRSSNPDFSRPGQLGNAWTDQFNSSLQGREPYVDPNEGNVYRGPIDSSGRKIEVESDGDPADNLPKGESDGDPLAPGPPSYPGTLPNHANKPSTLTNLAPAITPSGKRGYDPKTGAMSWVPYEAPRGTWQETDGRYRYQAPPSFARRLVRAASGFVKGPDTGKNYINWGLRGLRKGVPVTNLPLGVAGAVQGARSNTPMAKTWNPNDPENTLPQEDPRTAALNQAVTDPNAGRERTPPPLTTNPFSGGGGGGFYNPLGGGGGDYTDPNYNGGGGGQVVQNPNAPPVATTPPATTPPPTTPATSPLPTPPPTVPPGGHTAPPTTNPTPPQAQPRPPNPENRVNPVTGDPDPNGILPQHMPGYVPPTYISNTREGKLQVDALYKKYYGRDSTPEEFQAHVGNPGGIKAVEAALKAAPDALPQTAPPTTNTPPGSPAETAAISAVTGAGSGGGGYSYAGFDFGQNAANRDITKSAKYAFSHFAGQAAAKGVPQPRSKAEAQAWFEQHIAPGMNANGFKVHKVVGDKAFISTRERPNGEWIDFQGNSGGQGDQPLTWQDEGGVSGQNVNPEDIFAVQSGGGGGGGSSLGNSDPNGIGNVANTGNTALNNFARILINRLLEGAALEDALAESSRTTGISPASLGAVGF